MDISEYLITEYSGSTLAFRKPHNAIFSEEELEFLKKELCPLGKVHFLFLRTYFSQVVLVTCHFFDNEKLNSFIQKQSKKIRQDQIKEEKFVLCGYDYNERRDEHTLTFYAPIYEKFNEVDLLFFATQMYKYGATNVYNWGGEWTSLLKHLLTAPFNDIIDSLAMPSIYRLTCTFRNDKASLEAIDTLFKRYSKVPESLETECYENCFISSFNRHGSLTLLNSSNADGEFSTEELTKICSWLHSLGCTHIKPNAYKAGRRTLICNAIECSFAPDEKWNHKLKDFIDYNAQSYLKELKSMEIIPPDATEYSPNWEMHIAIKGISLYLIKEALKDTKLTHKERFYFLNHFSKFGVIEISTKRNSVYCEFSNDENGHKLRNEAVYSLIQ